MIQPASDPSPMYALTFLYCTVLYHYRCITYK